MAKLEEREIKLLELLVAGASNRAAAGELGIALRTMELHRQKLMQKLEAKSPAQLGYKYAEWKRSQSAASPQLGAPAPSADRAPERRLAEQHAGDDAERRDPSFSNRLG